jgi:hypothetical protein
MAAQLLQEAVFGLRCRAVRIAHANGYLVGKVARFFRLKPGQECADAGRLELDLRENLVFVAR